MPPSTSLTTRGSDCAALIGGAMEVGMRGANSDTPDGRSLNATAPSCGSAPELPARSAGSGFSATWQ
jgi:hypothetical protein